MSHLKFTWKTNLKLGDYALSSLLPTKFYLFKVNNRNTRERCELWSITIKTLKWRHHVVVVSLLWGMSMFHTFSSISFACECLKSYLLSENFSRNTFKKIRLEIYLRYGRESIISRSLSGNLLQQNTEDIRIRILTLEHLMFTKKSYILKQKCSWKLQVCLSMYNLFVDTRC